MREAVQFGQPLFADEIIYADLKENVMRRLLMVVGTLMLLLGAMISARAQMGMDLFKKPSIAKAFNPVVGKGAEYQVTRTKTRDNAPRTMAMGVVGKDTVDGEDAFWMEFATADDRGQAMVGKALLTKSSFKFSRMIVQMASRPAMEMPFNPSDARGGKQGDQVNDWHSVGTETITVPAGTFSCEHWKSVKNNREMWTSEKVVPLGLVKQVDDNGSMVLTRQISDFTDRITGPVQKFDPQSMMQQMQRGQPPQKP